MNATINKLLRDLTKAVEKAKPVKGREHFQKAAIAKLRELPAYLNQASGK